MPSKLCPPLTAAIVLSLSALPACSGDVASRTSSIEEMPPPDTARVALADPRRASFPAPEWEVRSPEEQGLRASGLDAALDYAFRPEKNTQGVVIIRGRAIVAERYEEGRDAGSFGASWSVAKSFASAVIGIAIEHGYIPSVDVPLTDYYPDWADTPKAEIRLRHVLQMASGLAWTEDYESSEAETSDVIQMVLSADALEYASSVPSMHAPGTVFNYSSGDTMLVSGVLEQATGMSAAEFAARELFSKIGMTKVDWWRDTASHTLTYCCLDTSARDFAKFGLLFLERGEWNGKRIISEAWIDDSLRASPSDPGYGYFFWLVGATTPELPADTFAAHGVDDQHIYVIPSLDLVVVRNGHYDKHPGEPVADPNLFAVYPSFGLVPGAGTKPADSWSDTEFLAPIVQAVEDY